MGEFALYSCLATSVAGSVFLTFIGVLCFIDYEFLALSSEKGKDTKGVKNKPNHGWTCIYAAGLYFTIAVLLVIYKAKRIRRNKNWKRLDTSNDEEISFTEAVKLKIK